MIEPPDFDELYRRDADPWRVGTSWYEQRKLRVVLASLCRARYRLAWDPACGTGHLARALAGVADRVLATDASPAAVAISRRTCAALDTVRLATNRLPDVPSRFDQFDLIVLSEFLYYLPADQRRHVVANVEDRAAPGAEIVGVHWRHRPHDAYAGGAEIQHELVERGRANGWSHRVHHREEDFVLDVLQRRDAEPAGE